MARGRKTGGRQKGSRNKRTVSKDLAFDVYCQQEGYDPLRAMVELTHTTGAISDREWFLLSIHKETAQYLYTKRKAVPEDAGTQTVYNIQVIHYGVPVESPRERPPDQPHPAVAVPSTELSTPTLRRFGTGLYPPDDGVAQA